MCKLLNTLAASKECSINVAILLKERPWGWTCTQEAPGISQTLWAGLGWADSQEPRAGRVPELSLQPSAGLLHTDGAGGGGGAGAALRGVSLFSAHPFLQPTYAHIPSASIPNPSRPLACWRSPWLKAMFPAHFLPLAVGEAGKRMCQPGLYHSSFTLTGQQVPTGEGVVS